MKKIDLIGQKFGKLSVLEEIEWSKSPNRKFLCVCDCGKKTIVPYSNLKYGNTKSCGCLRKEFRKKIKVEHKEEE